MRDVQRNTEVHFVFHYILDGKFLFAVVRDVQRNPSPVAAGHCLATRFYSLSCETYSGT